VVAVSGHDNVAVKLNVPKAHVVARLPPDMELAIYITVVLRHSICWWSSNATKWVGIF
jgi:hypothetical protein